LAVHGHTLAPPIRDEGSDLEEDDFPSSDDEATDIDAFFF